MNNIIKVLTLSCLSFYFILLFSSCSNNNENQPKGPKFYLKEYSDLDGTYNFQYNAKTRKIIHETGLGSRYYTYEYPSDTIIIKRYYELDQYGDITTYTLNKKGLAIKSVSESVGYGNKTIENKNYEYNSDGYLIKTTTSNIYTYPNSNMQKITNSVTTQIIENGDIIETKTTINDSVTDYTSYKFTGITVNDYASNKDFLGKKNTHAIESSFTSYYFYGYGKIKMNSKYSNYVVNADNLVESVKVDMDVSVDGVQKEPVWDIYHYVYEKF